MKLDSKTLKYIMYALIVIFFLILIGQYIKPPDIEGLENKKKEDDEEKNTEELDEKRRITEATELKNIKQYVNKISNDETGILSSLQELTEYDQVYIPGMMTPYLSSSTSAPFNTSDISGIATSFTTNTTKSLLDISQNIANMKTAANLNTKTGMSQAGYIIDRFIEQTRLMGINLLLNYSEIKNRFGTTYNIYIDPFIKNYKSNMDTLQDLKAYTEDPDGGGNPTGLLGALIPSAKPGGFGGIS